MTTAFVKKSFTMSIFLVLIFNKRPKYQVGWRTFLKLVPLNSYYLRRHLIQIPFESFSNKILLFSLAIAYLTSWLKSGYNKAKKMTQFRFWRSAAVDLVSSSHTGFELHTIPNHICKGRVDVEGGITIFYTVAKKNWFEWMSKNVHKLTFWS